MKFFRILLLIAFIAPLSAQAQDKSVETVIRDMTMLHCIAPLFVGDDIARIARQQGLIEFPPEAAAKFLKDEKGAVFATKEAPGYIVLKALDNGVCQIFIREADSEKLWALLDNAFDPQISPWELVKEEIKDDMIAKSYRTNRNGEIAAFISVSNEPRKNAPQAVITISRVQ